MSESGGMSPHQPIKYVHVTHVSFLSSSRVSNTVGSNGKQSNLVVIFNTIYKRCCQDACNQGKGSYRHDHEGCSFSVCAKYINDRTYKGHIKVWKGARMGPQKIKYPFMGSYNDKFSIHGSQKIKNNYKAHFPIHRSQEFNFSFTVHRNKCFTHKIHSQIQRKLKVSHSFMESKNKILIRVSWKLSPPIKYIYSQR